MKVLLYSEDFTLSHSWQEKITLCQSEILEDVGVLQHYKNLIIILDYACCYKQLSIITTVAKTNNIKILLLDSTPTFEKGKKVLNFGVQGYGNTLMSSAYLNSAIETIKDNMIWIYPQFTSSLIQGFSKEQNTPDEIVQMLTSRELDIALFIKDGLSNSEICERLEISINTVKSHIKNIYEKLKVKNRISLSLIFKSQ